MLHDGRAIRVAVVGGSRIPFCRSQSIYRLCSNKDLMTAALDGLVELVARVVAVLPAVDAQELLDRLLEQANAALADLRAGNLSGAAVLNI